MCIASAHQWSQRANKVTVVSLIEAPGAWTRAQEEAKLDLENQAQL